MQYYECINAIIKYNRSITKWHAKDVRSSETNVQKIRWISYLILFAYPLIFLPPKSGKQKKNK